MKSESITRALIPLIAICLTAPGALAQLPAGLSNVIPGGGGGAGAGSAAVDRVQAQVQQRVQAQVQQRVQTQVQQQLQTQIQSRVQLQSQRAAATAQRAAMQAKRRAENASNTAAGLQLGINASANSQTGMNVAGNNLQLGSDTQIGVRSNGTLPRGVTEADVALYQSVFGEFNPLQPSQSDRSEPGAAEPSESASNDTPDTAEPSESASNDSPDTAEPSESASNDTPPSENETASDQQSPETCPTDLLSSTIDLSARIKIAARQRRAQISAMRDQAVETANAQLLSRADQMEHRLNMFVATQAEIQARIQSAAQSSTAAAIESGQSQLNLQTQNAQQVRGQAQSTVQGYSQLQTQVTTTSDASASAAAAEGGTARIASQTDGAASATTTRE